MKVRFLLDENLSPRVKIAVRHLAAEIDILCVGEAGAPPFGTLDPAILDYLEFSQRLLVTENRVSMPGHLDDHWAKGGQIWGLCWVRPQTPIGRLAEELQLIWEASEAEEWIDRLEWIPFS
jgi:hypothetical protein